MMTLTDAIMHAEERAKSCDMLANISLIGEAKERNHRCAEEHRQLAEWLKELQRYQWIPTSERLPEEVGRYLVSYTWLDNVSVEIMAYIGGDFYSPRYEYSDETCDTVIAWMELPKPYEAKGVDDEA